ncbi:creatinine amidohydrolase [Microbacterium sp. SORGH_AS 1204]|uniref:creatininase family protein n=1 Tax=Microbacterium sp. SORGH_AS_1204 TaxID=3041785 RepID=UPI00278CD7CE|nr:creatininase family protein [Microbacterium sp. SORGH_AS_1204]MDQ1137684.1 creatinine amidohydrolase [Microbacterium sp. SORGH_AS_1204]
MPESTEIARIADRDGVALVPVGATEQHGPHLSVTTDTVIAAAFAAAASARVAKDVATWVLPAIPFGYSPEHAGRPGTISLSPDTLLALADDIGRGVAASGIRRLLFVNGHGGNPELLHVACRQLRERRGLAAFAVHVPGLPLPPELTEGVTTGDLDAHAGHYETSVMLSLDPAAVRRDAARADGLAEVTAAAASLTRPFGAVSVPWHVDDLSASGVIGDPTTADAGWGARAFAAQAATLADIVRAVAAHSLPPEWVHSRRGDAE